MKTEFTTMIMITDPKTQKCAVIDRKKSWRGPAFPGGHVEKGESFFESAKREAYEETGLKINSLESCGVIHWINEETDERYVVFCYRTDDFSGKLKKECDEGELFWTDFDRIEQIPSENDFKLYLPLFKGGYTEAVGHHNSGGNTDFYYL